MPLFLRYPDDDMSIDLARYSQRDVFEKHLDASLSKSGNYALRNSGEILSEDKVFDSSPWASAIRLISNQGSRLPLQIIDTKQGKVVDDVHTSWIRKSPCLGMTRVQWKKMCFTSLLLRGVCFIKINNWYKRDGTWYPDVLTPLPSRYVTTTSGYHKLENNVDRTEQAIEVVYNPSEKQSEHSIQRYLEWLGPNDLSTQSPEGRIDRCMVIRFDDDGSVEGRNPVICSQSILGVALAAQTNAKLYFENGGDMSGIAAFDDAADGEVLRQKMAFYRDKRAPEHRGGILFTNRPVSFIQMNLSAQEQQLIESREFSVEEIARLFNIPAPMLGDSTTNWGTGVQALERFTHNYAIVPYLKAFTDYLSWTLPRKYEVEFNSFDYHFDDPRTSVELLTEATGGPFMMPNEARKIMRLEDVEDGDRLRASKYEKLPTGEEDTVEKSKRADKDTSRDKSGKTDK